MSNPFQTSFSRGPIIENEAAYEDAIRRNIRNNARKGREARWFAEDRTRGDVVAFLVAYGTDDEGMSKPGFIGKMHAGFEEWGTLTAGQEAAVRKIMADRAEKDAARKSERAAAAAKSVHVGTVGERRDFTLTVTFITGFETQFGYMTITGFADADGNIVIYKGQDLGVEKGAAVTLKATIKAHGERDGAKQTIISRPKVAA